MTAFPSYATGTVSVNNGDTAIVGVSTIWSGVNARPGDIIIVNGLAPVEIKDVTDVTHLALWSAWAGGTQAAVSYTIIQKSPQRFAGGQAMADVSSLVAALNTDGFYFFVGPTLSVPDPSYGNDNQFAFQPSTSKLWLKTGGTWVFQGIFKGLNITGAWSSATAYNLNDVVSLAGTSYVATAAGTNHTPPNVSFWAVLAAVGATGAGYGGTSTTSLAIATGSKAFTTQAGLAYQVGSYVRASSAANGANYMEGFVTAYSGTTLTINVIQIGGSGTLADWGFATAGAVGIGYGGSSTTSLLIATGSKVFTGVATTLAYQVGNYARASSAANGANYMEGFVTAYAGGSLTINVTKIGGSGTLADWNFATAGAPGSGDLLSTNNLSDVTNKDTAISNLHGVNYNAAQSLTAAQASQARINIVAQAQGDFAGMNNGTLVASASAGALTVAVKTFAGVDPSAGDPVYFYFRNNTAASGDFTRIAVTAAMSILIGSGTTVGATSGFGLRLWITAHNDAGTVRLGAINCSDSTSVFCPQEHNRAYTTSTPNNSAKLFYSTTAIGAGAPWRFIGFCEWTPLTTAGTWTAPTIVHLFGPGSKKPGDIVQHGFYTKVTTASTTSSTMAACGLNALLTPTSTANLIVGSGSAPGFCGTASKNQFSVVRRGASTNVSTFNEIFIGTIAVGMASWNVFDRPNSLSQQTYDIYFANADNATSISMPYCTDGGTMYLNLQELMG